MEGFSYVDIFATKGVEYLLVIGFLVVLVFFWRFLNSPSPETVSTQEAAWKLIPISDWFRFAENLFYHQGHSWAKPEDNGVVLVGMDDFAQKLLGRPRQVELPRVGAKVRQGEKAWNLHVDGKTIDMLSPVDGKVVAINEEVLHHPDLINQDPYEKGWLLKVRVRKMKTNLKNLLSGHLAKAWLEETENKLRERMTGEFGLALQDGGIPVSGIAMSLDPEHWEDVAREFLLTD